MVSAFVIVFRESLEAALIISIVMAASQGIPRRSGAVLAGAVAGLAGAALLAAFAGEIAALFSGTGNEAFNAAALLIAVIMLGWHHVWMGTHGRELAQETREVGEGVKEGSRPLSALAIVCAVAVLREGSETVLFLYGISLTGNENTASMLSGGFLGVAAAAVLGALIYFGLLRVPLKHIFKVTGILLVLIAAGLAAQAASLLTQAGYLPPLGYDIWDTSAILSQTSPVGFLLHILVGYVDRPLGIQVVAYIVVLALILGASWLVSSGRPQKRTPAKAEKARP